MTTSQLVRAVQDRLLERYGADRPRLRFDKVALRFVADLQEALRDAVPPGKTLVLTCTAPIRQSSKTAAALTERVRHALARPRARFDFRDVINANGVGARLVDAGSSRMPKVVGFVHNPDKDCALLLDLVGELLKRDA